jgi:hypothetical protein
MPDSQDGTQRTGNPVASNTTPTDIESRVARVTAPGKLSAGDWVLLASYNETLLDQEFKLQDRRVNWMMTTQSVLVATFCLILLNVDTNFGAAQFLLNWIPWMAVVIVLSALSGIISAQIVIYNLEHERSYYQAVLAKVFGNITIPDIGSRRQGWLRRTRLFGFAPVIVIIFMFLFIWLSIWFSRTEIIIKVHDYKPTKLSVHLRH